MSPSHNKSVAGEQAGKPVREPSSIRECFDPAPYEEDDMPKNTAEENGGAVEERDALRSYFREMSEVQQLTPQQEVAIWQQIDESLVSMRKILYRFGFVYAEHIRLLSDQELDDLGDVFPTDPNDPKDDFTINFQKRRVWCEKIKDISDRLKQAYEAGRPEEELERLRQEGASVMSERPVLPGKLLEWHDVALHYVQLLKAGRMTRTELEKKIFASVSDFEAAVAKAADLREEFEKWKLRMLETNLRLVINIAKHYQNKGLPFGDLIQEGNLGLMKALEKFDYKLGHRFCTYASWWIRQGVSRALSAQSRVIRLPIHMLATIRKMNIAEKNFIQAHGEEPTDSDIAAMLEMPVERIRAIRKMSVQCLSLQAPQMEDSETSTFENFLSDKESDDPMKTFARKVMKERLDDALDQLSERERQVITLRYGLDGGPCQTLTEVSAAFKVTRERVRQIELKTLDKLRKHSDHGRYLDDFFL